MQQGNRCTKCGDEPRVPKQRWCLLCRAAYMRQKRAVHGWRYGEGTKSTESELTRLKRRNRKRGFMRRKRHPPGEDRCISCDATDNIEHHHPDHVNKPNWTIPFCRRCHAGLHRSKGLWPNLQLSGSSGSSGATAPSSAITRWAGGRLPDSGASTRSGCGTTA